MSEQLPSVLQACFDLSDGLTWTEVGSGHMNRTWIGVMDGEKRYALRLYNSSRTRDDIKVEHHCLVQLNQYLPEVVSLPLVGKHGQSICTTEYGLVALFSILTGEHPTPGDHEWLSHAGSILADCHALFWEKRDQFDFLAINRPPWPQSLAEEAQRNMHEIRHHDEAGFIPAELLTFSTIREITHQVEEATLALKAIREYCHLIHGDFGGSNLLINPATGSVTGILDWEECRWDSPIFDLVGLGMLSKQDDAAYNEVFLSAYLERLERTAHPLARHTRKCRKLLPKAAYLDTFGELILMIHKGQYDWDYLTKLLDRLTSPV